MAWTKDKRQVQVVMPIALHERLREVAATRDKSTNEIIVSLLEGGLRTSAPGDGQPCATRQQVRQDLINQLAALE